MKGLYIECKMGAAGDMLTAALLELLPENKRQEAVTALQNIGLDGVEFSTEKMMKCGIQGTHVHVHVNGQEEESHDAHHHEHHEHEHSHEEHHHHEEHEHHHEEHHHHDEEHLHSHEEHHHHDEEHLHSHEEHHHHHEHEHSHEEHHHHHHEHEHSHEEHHHHHHEHHKLSDVESIINQLKVSDKVKNNALAVYNLIAQAESHAHGVEVDQIHFHEVGNKDAIMDVTAVCYLMDLLGAEKIIASPVHVGSGSVHCAHGIMPVPAPATEFLLRGIPYYQGEIKNELCTPTGAALLKFFAQDFGPQPMMKIEQVGIGCGKKDFPAANCVRIFMGEIVASDLEDHIIQLDANIDDMSAEEIGFAMNRLFDAGAREVFTSSVYMKKNRPGTLITVICSEDKKEEIVKTFFKHTTTIGIRQKSCDRYVLKRENSVKKTSVGDVRIKTSSGYGKTTAKYEYDDLAQIALKNNMSLREVKSIIEKE